ncbi:MAG: C40 family peptidase [Alicyclobacillus sp.]|nr:C40 family peptidase [Alicyclobacillus sp.]
MKKKTLMSLCASAVCAGAALFTAPAAAFADVSASDMTMKGIVFNQDVVSKPYGFVQNGTTYLPIWYLMQALHQLQVNSHWANQSWTLVTSGSTTPDLSNVNPGTGTTSIYLNGELVQKVDTVVATDPSSGKPTTYMPAWYIMQLLNRLQVHSKWNGTVWQMYTGTTPPAIGNLDIQPNTRPPAARSAPSLGEQIVQYAEQFIGTPYQYGGTSANGFDCSGFVQAVFAHFGKTLPRTAAEQAQVGSAVSEQDLNPGDLVFFDTEGSPFSHVGIYVGNGEFISATTSRGVRICKLEDSSYWGPRFTKATDPGV